MSLPCVRCERGDHGKCRDERAMGSGIPGVVCGCALCWGSPAVQPLPVSALGTFANLMPGPPVGLTFADVLADMREVARALPRPVTHPGHLADGSPDPVFVCGAVCPIGPYAGVHCTRAPHATGDHEATAERRAGVDLDVLETWP